MEKAPRKSRRSSDGFPSREDVLNLAIKQTLGDLHPKKVDVLCGQYDESITEIFEIVEKRKNSAMISCLYDEIILETVIFPSEVHLILKKRDVFLMTLGRDGENWKPLWMSPLMF